MDKVPGAVRVVPSTGYKWALIFSTEEFRTEGGLASGARFYLNKAVGCILVGYDEPAQLLFERASEWLQIAINEDERPKSYGPGSTEAQRHLDLALCNWLLNGEHDDENFHNYVNHMDRFLETSKLGRNKTEISLLLPHHVDAGAYRQALVWYDVAGMSPPRSLAVIQAEGQMSYVLCQYLLGEQYAAADVEKAAQKFLHRSVNAWLIDGHFLRAAEWMKIIHWNSNRADISSREAVLRCYDYLAEVV